MSVQLVMAGKEGKIREFSEKLVTRFLQRACKLCDDVINRENLEWRKHSENCVKLLAAWEEIHPSKYGYFVIALIALINQYKLHLLSLKTSSLLSFSIVIPHF